MIDNMAVRFHKVDEFWGIGTFDLIYAGIFLNCCLLATLRYWHNINYIQRGVLILLFLLILFVVIKANFMIAFMLLLFSLCITVLLPNNRHEYGKFMIFVLLSLIVIIFKYEIAQFIYLLGENIPFTDLLKEKFINIGDYLSGDKIRLGTLSKRQVLFDISLSTFYNNILWGIDYNLYDANTVGCHAQWIDDLARFGIIGNAILYGIYINLFMSMRIFSTHRLDTKCIYVTWIIIIILGFLNPTMLAPILSVIFIIAPFISSLLKQDRRIGL